MANLSSSTLTDKVRQALDEITLDGEQVTTDSDLEDIASSNFSDADIQERLLNGVRYIAARVRAVHLPNLVTSGDPTGSWNWSTVLRILGSRIVIGSVTATRRTFMGDKNLETNGQSASNTYTIYIYEDQELFLRDSGAFSSGGDVSDTLNDGTPTVFYVQEPTAISDLTDKFERAVIEYALSDCYMTLGEPNMSATSRERLQNEIRPYLRTLFIPEQ